MTRSTKTRVAVYALGVSDASQGGECEHLAWYAEQCKASMSDPLSPSREELPTGLGEWDQNAMGSLPLPKFSSSSCLLSFVVTKRLLNYIKYIMLEGLTQY